jgi:hypothetical protein
VPIGVFLYEVYLVGFDSLVKGHGGIPGYPSPVVCCTVMDLDNVCCLSMHAVTDLQMDFFSVTDHYVRHSRCLSGREDNN